jgi:hypothetical protein
MTKNAEQRPSNNRRIAALLSVTVLRMKGLSPLVGNLLLGQLLIFIQLQQQLVIANYTSYKS